MIHTKGEKIMSKQKNIPEELLEKVTEVAEEELENVAGGTNPFGDLPRVPNQPIDPNLRENA